MKAHAVRVRPSTDSMAYLALVSVYLPDIAMEITGIRIIQAENGRVYASLPHQRSSEGKYFPLLCFQDPEDAETIKRVALEAWERF